MNLHSTQMALFKAYLDPGYRLAHRLDASAYAAHMGLHGEDAEIIVAITPEELDDFAASLRGKHGMLLKSALPCTCEWIEKNRPTLIREYFDVFRPSRSQGREAVVAGFPPFLREYCGFWEGVAEALPDVADFELALFFARQTQRTSPGFPPGGEVSDGIPQEFSWESLYWKLEHTCIVSFSADPLSIFLGKSEMTAKSKPASILVAPSPYADVPVILRLASVAYDALRNLSEPMSAYEMMELCIKQGVAISEGSLKSLLVNIGNRGAIGHRYVEGGYGRR
ncbi:hypothetical protein [Streptomyces sp. NBC_00893]|uniref:hypothetical protein n=1 Tax=Streptomyces sp. NBC_00893 TaxID=2975862 RepID=UPI00224CB137|nr:hypothetical protein [Streptomyces sp. NBC_00893]MCX4845489.1 hypothetical protein [Streptomyces sp. NBC_00893]